MASETARGKGGAPSSPQSGPDIPILLSTAEVAVRFNRSDRTIRRWVRQGHLTPVRVGGSLYFRADEVRRLAGAELEDAIRKRATGKADG